MSSEIGGTISVIDNATRAVTHKITFEIAGLRAELIQPVGVRITADGKKAYVALGPANRVAVVNTQTYEVEKYVLVGQRVWQLAFTPDQKTIISTNGVSNDITFIDVATDEPVQSVTVGRCHGASSCRPIEAINMQKEEGNHEQISGTRIRRLCRHWLGAVALPWRRTMTTMTMTATMQPPNGHARQQERAGTDPRLEGRTVHRQPEGFRADRRTGLSLEDHVGGRA